MDLRNLNFVCVIDDTECIEQPNHHANNDNDIENFFNFAVHRDVGIDQPEQNSNYNQSYDERNKRHKILMIGEADGRSACFQMTIIL